MKQIYTIGHSTKTLDDLVGLLKLYEIKTLIDVRHFPRSRHNPQFNIEQLEKNLPKIGIGYQWLEILGGFRPGGYKKYTCTRDFKIGLNRLIKIAEKNRTAIMCAEILWFKCHRRYIADALKRKRWYVVHIYDDKRTEKHKISLKRKIKCDLTRKPRRLVAGFRI